MSQFLFHVTKRENLVNIRQEGLMPSQHRWHDDREHHGVAMYTSQSDALYAIKRFANRRWSDHVLVILIVDVSNCSTLTHKNQEVLVLSEHALSQERVSVSQVVTCKRWNDRNSSNQDDDVMHIHV